MPVWILIAVAGRIAGSCIASIQQKRLYQAGESSSRIVAVSMALVAAGVIALDWRFIVRIFELPPAFWWLLSISALLDTLGNVLLVRSVGTGDLSVVGPLNSYKPIVASLFGYFFFRETPSWAGIGGMTAILIGSFLLIERRAPNTGISTPAFSNAIFIRLASIVFTSIASLFLKSAIEFSDSWTAFQGWSIISAIAAACLIGKRMKPKPDAPSPRSASFNYISLAGSLILMQSLTVWLFSQMSVGYALALFQLSSLVQVGLGISLFGERDLARRTIAATIMTAGAVLVLIVR